MSYLQKTLNHPTLDGGAGEGCGLFTLFEYNISTILSPIWVSTQMKRCFNVKKEKRFMEYCVIIQAKYFHILLRLLPFTFHVLFFACIPFLNAF